jgi:hypothetical protein
VVFVGRVLVQQIFVGANVSLAVLCRVTQRWTSNQLPLFVDWLNPLKFSAFVVMLAAVVKPARLHAKHQWDAEHDDHHKQLRKEALIWQEVDLAVVSPGRIWSVGDSRAWLAALEEVVDHHGDD